MTPYKKYINTELIHKVAFLSQGFKKKKKNFNFGILFITAVHARQAARVRMKRKSAGILNCTPHCAAIAFPVTDHDTYHKSPPPPGSL